LIEARLLNLQDVLDVVRFEEAMGRAFARAGAYAVICADWRAAHILAPEVADRLIGLLRRANPRIRRAGILLAGGHAIFGLQVERVVREAGNPARKTFHSAKLLHDWLSEELQPVECSAMDEFLGPAVDEIVHESATVALGSRSAAPRRP
jgi:hypothetical protein